VDVREAFERLGLARGATEDEINGAYRALAAGIHPDRATNAEEAKRLTAEMQLLNDAKAVALEGSGELAASTTTDLMVREVGELIRQQNAREERLEAKERSRDAIDRAVQSGGIHLRHRQRRAASLAALATIISGAAAAFAALGGVGGETLQTVWGGAAALFLLYAAWLGLRAWGIQGEVDRLRIDIEDLAAELSKRSRFIARLRDIETASEMFRDLDPLEDGMSIPELYLREGIADWLESDRATVPEAARAVGEKAFADLFITKGLENGILREQEDLVDGLIEVSYRLDLVAPG
jgi:hypothetical protein